jgi:GNAT superfamily N-acetyltransferase
MDVTASTTLSPDTLVPPAGAVLVVALDHPSLDGRVAAFTDALRAERRRFEPGASADPEPFPSLLVKIEDPRSLRIGVLADGRLIGAAAIAADGEVAIAVAPDRRGRGVGRLLLGAALERAARDGFARLHLLTSRRSKPVVALGDALGWTAVDTGGGRVELFVDLDRISRTV